MLNLFLYLKVNVKVKDSVCVDKGLVVRNEEYICVIFIEYNLHSIKCYHLKSFLMSFDKFILPHNYTYYQYTEHFYHPTNVPCVLFIGICFLSL